MPKKAKEAKKAACLFLFFLSVSTCSFALSPFGLNLSYVIAPRELSNMHGVQLMLNYFPASTTWQHWQIYFDGGFSHFWVYHTDHHERVDVVSVAPVFRYQFNAIGVFAPYIDASVGFAYLSHRHLANRNLGIHFSFQDRAGVGTWIGPARKLSLGVHAMHYSNANIGPRNSGFTAPAVLDLGYRFG